MRSVNADLFRRVYRVFSIVKFRSWPTIDPVLGLDLPVLQMTGTEPLHLDI